MGFAGLGIATVITGVAWLREGLALKCVRFEYVGRVTEFSNQIFYSVDLDTSIGTF